MVFESCSKYGRQSGMEFTAKGRNNELQGCPELKKNESGSYLRIFNCGDKWKDSYTQAHSELKCRAAPQRIEAHELCLESASDLNGDPDC